MHTYILAYLHTYIHTYVRTYVHTYMHTSTRPSPTSSLRPRHEYYKPFACNLGDHFLAQTLQIYSVRHAVPQSAVQEERRPSPCVASTAAKGPRG